MEGTLEEAMGDVPVEALKESMEETMERLMADYGDGLMKLCFMMLSDRALAEDAVQETFFKAFRAYPRFRHDSSEYTWLTRIAVNTCKSLRARAWFRREERRAEPAEGTDQRAADDLPDDTVLRAVMALAPKYKEPVLLHYYQGLPTKEIAIALGVAQSSVSVRLMRARDMLKDQLKEWYFDE